MTPDATVPLTTMSRSRRIVAVASGKGGVGKTWLAITLSHALARRGRRVLLFDGDLGLANVDIQLGLTPDSDLAAVAAGRISLAAAVRRYEAGGFDVLAGRSGSGALSALDPAVLERILAALQGAAGGFDHIVLDLGAGLDRSVRRMSAWADTLLVVLTEEPTALTDAYAALKLYAVDRRALGTPGDPLIVVNQAANPGSGERVHAALARACQNFLGEAPPLAGIIRRDDRVRDAIRRQSLLLARHPNAAAAADVERVADALSMVHTGRFCIPDPLIARQADHARRPA